jgi:RHS repeat-associated protein
VQQGYYIVPDHLNTPRAIQDQTGNTVWRWDQREPFGVTQPNTDPDGDGVAFDFPLRFPGQYQDRETSLNYNYFRDYDPSVGRYVQSDPIGLRGGLNSYLYGKGDPLRNADRNGLGPLVFAACAVLSYGYTAYTFYHEMHNLLESTAQLRDQLLRVNQRISQCPIDDPQLAELDRIKRDLELALAQTTRAGIGVGASGLVDFGLETVAFGTCTLLLATPTP